MKAVKSINLFLFVLLSAPLLLSLLVRPASALSPSQAQQISQALDFVSKVATTSERKAAIESVRKLLAEGKIVVVITTPPSTQPTTQPTTQPVLSTQMQAAYNDALRRMKEGSLAIADKPMGVIFIADTAFSPVAIEKLGIVLLHEGTHWIDIVITTLALPFPTPVEPLADTITQFNQITAQLVRTIVDAAVEAYAINAEIGAIKDLLALKDITKAQSEALNQLLTLAQQKLQSHKDSFNKSINLLSDSVDTMNTMSDGLGDRLMKVVLEFLNSHPGTPILASRP